MIFTDKIPTTWRDLQNRVAQLLSQAGYTTKTPHTINTARGTVEVDVYIESPDELIKLIICECKFWDTAIPKEKVHAFRTVVNDSGAEVGLLISKNGFQSGAIEAAKYSNIKLITWDDFTEMIKHKWIYHQLKRIKELSAPLSIYTNPLDFPFEELKEDDKSIYSQLCKRYMPLRHTCWLITQQDLLNDTPTQKLHGIDQAISIENYLDYLTSEINTSLVEFEKVLASSNIKIPETKFEKSDTYLYMFLKHP